MVRCSRSVLVLSLSLMSCALSVGCACTPGQDIKRQDITVTMDPSVQGQSVTVYAYAANANDATEWNNVPVTTFFYENNPLHSPSGADRAELVLGPGHETMHVIPATDPVWTAWQDKKAFRLFILADIPTLKSSTGAGDEDPRRKILSLDKCRWKGESKGINIHVGASGLAWDQQTLDSQVPESGSK